MRMQAIVLSLFFAMIAAPLVARDERALFPTNLRHEWTIRMPVQIPVGYAGVLAMYPAQDQLFYAGAFAGRVDFDYGPGIDMRDSGSYNNADLCVSAMGLDGSYRWTYSVGGPGVYADLARGVVADSQGNVTIVGEFYDAVDFDPGPGEDIHIAGDASDNHAFVTRLSPLGAYQWTRAFSGPGGGTAMAVDADQEGMVIFAGSFGGLVDLDPGPSERNVIARFYDVFVEKLDQNGNLEWVNIFGGPGADDATDLAVGPEDEVVVVGNFRYSADFDPGPRVDLRYTVSAFPNKDVFITKFKADGSYLWTRTMQTEPENPRVEVGLDGAVICAGRIDHDADMDPTEGVDWRRVHVPNQYADGFVTKLGPDGSYRWTYMISGSDYEYVFEHQVLGSGEIIAVGTYRGVLELPAEVGLRRLECNAAECGFQLSLSPDGRLNWALSFGGRIDYLLSASQSGIFLFGTAGYGLADRFDANITCKEEAEYLRANLTKLQYGPSRGGDVDFDGDVDLRDVARFYQCYTGDPRDKHNDPLQVDCGAGCDEFDLSPDAVLDRDDFALLLKRFEGPK